MQVAIEISMYPLTEQYEAAVVQFIQKLRANPEIEVHTNELSTQVAGAYDLVMNALQQEMKTAFEAANKSAFVLKILPTEITPGSTVTI